MGNDCLRLEVGLVDTIFFMCGPCSSFDELLLCILDIFYSICYWNILPLDVKCNCLFLLLGRTMRIWLALDRHYNNAYLYNLLTRSVYLLDCRNRIFLLHLFYFCWLLFLEYLWISFRQSQDLAVDFVYFFELLSQKF